MVKMILRCSGTYKSESPLRRLATDKSIALIIAEIAPRSELIKSRAASGFALLCPTFRSDNVSLLIYFCERGIAENLKHTG
jgi:hypothetical protein